MQSNIKTGFIEKNKSAIIAVILVIGILGVFYQLGFFEFLLPIPSIALIDINKNTEEDWQTVLEGEGPLAQEISRCKGTDVSVSFTMVNSGNLDGYVSIKLDYGDMLMDSDRYFVKGGEEIKETLGKKVVSCSIKKDLLELVYTIERP